MLLRLDGHGPVYQQIYRALRAAILTGTLPPHTRLSSTRGLAQETGVSRNTVVIAYEQLLAEGYIVGQLGSGTFVAQKSPMWRTRLWSGAGSPTRRMRRPPMTVRPMRRAPGWRRRRP